MNLVDTVAAAHAVRVSPATIRSWAHRGKLKPQGADRKGRALYRLDDVYRTKRDTLARRNGQTFD